MLQTEVAPTGPELSLLRLDTVKARTGLGRSAIYKLISEDRFPAPRHISGTRVSVWPSTEIDRWIAAQINGGRSNG